MIAQQKGFSLIEVIIIVAIITILASVALPLYETQTYKKRRTDGITGLTRAAREMERCYSNSGSYAACTLSTEMEDSPEKFYSIAITAQTTEEYILTGTDNLPGDTDCTSLILNHLGEQTHTGGQTNARRCWGGS